MPLLFEDLAPPDAVRFPAAPLLVPVEVLEPPDFEEVADRAADDFDAAFLAVPADFEAPVLLAVELFDVAPFREPPVDAVPDLFPPCVDFDEDFELEVDFFAPPLTAADLDELFAVAISFISRPINLREYLGLSRL